MPLLAVIKFQEVHYLQGVDMSTFLIALANRVASVFSHGEEQNKNKQGKLIFHSDGSISLNLENKDVQQRISQQLKELKKIKVDSPKQQPKL